MKKKKIGLIFLMATIVISTFNIMIGPSKIAAADVSSFGADGANEVVMNETMENAMNVNAGYGDAAQQAWVKQLNDQWKMEMDTFQWTDTDSISTDIPKDASGKTWKWTDANEGVASITATATETVENNPLVIPVAKPGTIYEVYSGEQLKYALGIASRPGIGDGTTIRLMADLDMQGYEYNWSVASSAYPAAGHTGLTLDGNNKTIYNLGSNGNRFLNDLKAGSTIKDLTFESTKLVLGAITEMIDNYGLFKQTNSNGAVTKNIINNLVVRDSLFFNGGHERFSSYTSPIGVVYQTDIDDYYTINNKLYGGNNVHVGGATGRTDNSTIDSSFSVDSTIICTYQHSGGFIACTDGNLHVTDSFTNNKIYGNKSTGVFIGATTDKIAGGTVFTRCYTSGSVEGTDNLGGFIGFVDNTSYPMDIALGREPLTFNDCYSTSIVGMKSGGTNLGGFVGNIANPKNVVTFNNCYAAGEVGSIDTDVSADRDPNTSAYKSVGGFAGKTRTGPLDAATNFYNCFYDKQTTAMREWETGINRDAAMNLIPGGGEQPSGGKGDMIGIKGVLTSNSDKSGAGLAALPGTNGFTGFDQQDIIIGGNIHDLWLYDGNNLNPDLHNCEYPQLSVFASGTAAEWGEFTDMVRAFSFASAATIHQQVWDKCSDASHDSLATTTYDTVRDLTMRMTMTSYIEPVDPSAVHVEWTIDETKTPLYGRDVPVVGYRGQTYNDVYKRNYWTIDKFAPGIEWLTVKISINGVTGNRRLRIVPTANLAPGGDQLNLIEGDSYNHAQDMAMAYSTGPRINVDTDDITQGVFPDSPIENGDERKSILKNIMVTSGNDYTIDRTPGKVPDSFAVDNDKFTTLKTNFMTGADGVMPNNHPNTYMNVNLYKLPELTPDSSGNDVQIVLDDSMKINLEDPTNAHWRDKLNGKIPFAGQDLGRYVIEYLWVLDDARFIKDSKMLLIQPEPHAVNVYVKKANGSPNTKSLQLFMQEYDRADAVPTPSFSGTPTSKLSRDDISTGDAVLFAAKKSPDDTNLITKIEFEIHTADGTRHEEIVNPNIGDKFEFPMTYFYGSYENGGIYYVKQVEALKSYTLEYNAVDKYYFLKMDNTFEFDYTDGANKPHTLIRNDVDNDIDVTITIEPAPIPSGTLEITKQVKQDGAEIYTGEVFNFNVSDADKFATQVQVYSELNQNKISLNLPVGNYTIRELISMGYDLEGITIDGVPVVDISNVSIEIKKGETLSLVVINTRTTGGGGRGNVTNDLNIGT